MPTPSDRAFALARLYQLPAAFFSTKVDADFFRYLATKDADADLTGLAEQLADPELMQSAKQWGQEVAQQTDKESAFEELFEHLSKYVMADTFPPYSARYGNRQLFGEEQIMADVAGFYRAFAVEPNEKERVDHIGLELEFLSFLAFKEAVALQQHDPERASVSREARSRFLQEHVVPFLFAYLDATDRREPNKLMPPLAAFTRALVENELRFFGLKGDPS
ncbi:MAG TPA: molecular chaperone TorD family protein [Bdellovibrionota bacterium]|nr:molecular chaperone TorD family protein [Bdellovibrionota bacterium]